MSFTPLLAALALLGAHGGAATTNRAVVEGHMRMLTSVEFEGRLTLSKGQRLAAEYIADQMRSAGLKPGEKDGYLHAYETRINQRATERNILAFIDGSGAGDALQVGVDYVPLVGASQGKLVRGPAVWVGYGLKREKWDDFGGVDLKGAVAVMLRGVPGGADPVSNGQKARWAADAGAAGVVFVGPRVDDGPELPKLNRGQGLPPGLEIGAAAMTREAFERVTGLNYAELRGAKAPESRTLPFTIRMVNETEPNVGQATNVVGVLPGNDPKLKDEIIVIGAHYDHLGYGEVGSRTGVESIHFGADDNASGTTGVLALAQYFGATRSNRRTLIFQCYSGEEEGLLGSIAWVRDHPKEIERTVAMINMDMIGRLRENALTVFGVATAIEWPEVLKAISSSDLKIAQLPSSPPNSDHAAFYARNIPVLFFHTNLHAEYHTENDRLDTINLDGMVAVVDVVRQTIDAVDARDARLTFKRWNGAAEDPSPDQPRQTRRVRVGFIPDMASEEGPGVRISGVVPDSPAQKAGFKEGDRLLRFGDMELKSLEDLQKALVQAAPGVMVKVVFQRGDEQIVVDLTPEAPAT